MTTNDTRRAFFGRLAALPALFTAVTAPPRTRCVRDSSMMLARYRAARQWAEVDFHGDPAITLNELLTETPCKR